MHVAKFRPPKIHWRLYFTRKVLILGVLVIVTSYIEAHLHFRVMGRAHELALSTLAEHLFFGIPLQGE